MQKDNLMFNENWMNNLQFYKNITPFSVTTLKFGDTDFIVSNISSLVIKLMTNNYGYGLFFGVYVEYSDFFSKITELPISADEMETIKTNFATLNCECFRQMIQEKFKLDLRMQNINNSVEIQFYLKNPRQDNQFDCIQIMQDVFNQIAKQA